MKTVKFFIFLFLLTSTIVAQNISFNELDLIKSKSNSEIETFIKKRKFSFITSQSHSVQWKSNSGDIIQFNGKGVLVFMTYNKNIYATITGDLKKSSYKYTGKSKMNGIDVVSYSKGKATVFLTSVKNPENGRQAYSLTFYQS